MKSLTVVAALIGAIAVASQPAGVRPDVESPQIEQATVPGSSELILDHSAYPAGTYHLVLTKRADGSVMLARAQRVVVDLDGRAVGGPPVDPGVPDEPDEPPEKTILDQVRANFGNDREEFERQRDGLVLALKVAPGLSAQEANEQVQQWMGFVLGDTAERWGPWLEWFKAPIVAGEVSELDAYTDWIDQARGSLK